MLTLLDQAGQTIGAPGFATTQRVAAERATPASGVPLAPAAAIHA
jgi:hypothetical protein